MPNSEESAARPWPRYNGLLLYGDSTGNSSYEAVATEHGHRTVIGFDLRIEYAFPKAHTDSDQLSVAISNQISRCRSCSKGPATFDVRRRTVGSLI